YIGAILLITSCQKNQEVNSENAIPVRTFELQPDSISTYLEITGNLQAENEAQVFSIISGKLIQIRKKVGSTVTKDEIIAVIENRIWKEALNQAEASLESMKARYQQVRQDYERYQKLYKERAVSEQQWEQIRSAMQEADANLARLKAAYAQALEQYENTFIKAPFDGIVGTLYFDEGQMVATGQPVAKIVNTNLMRTKLYIPDIHIRKIKIGQRVYAAFPSFENRTFVGVINRIDPAIDPLSRTAEVEAVFQNEEKILKSGMYGVFNIEIEQKKNALIVPDNALLSQTRIEVDPETGKTNTIKSYYVFVAENDTASVVPVETGIESGDEIEITSGLKPGDQVIVVGQKIIKDGSRIEIVRD
ncbi:MAG: efflux RND transporter periplasmic adaptor subunit, partial [Calditrichaeota bacterium]